MKIRKFFESNTIDDINDFLIDFKDEGFEVNSEYFQGKVIVSAKYTGELNRVEFLENILNLISRIESIGYKSINDKLHVYTGDVDGKPRCSFKLRFEEPNITLNKDVDSFEEFKQYLEKGLDLKFYEWDTEVYIPNLDAEERLKLDIDKEKGTFVIVLEKGNLSQIQTNIDLSDVVLSDDEWAALNLWSIPDSDKERFLEPELQKSAKSKEFGFNKQGIEAVEKCLNTFKR
jgi:hypothetical protein